MCAASRLEATERDMGDREWDFGNTTLIASSYGPSCIAALIWILRHIVSITGTCAAFRYAPTELHRNRGKSNFRNVAEPDALSEERPTACDWELLPGMRGCRLNPRRCGTAGTWVVAVG